jgi:hypothetical protein
MYYDMNNLYGTAMCEPLPHGSFAFMPENEVTNFDFMSVSDDSPTGYLLEVDIDYPDRLHDDHNDYPLCPESIVIDAKDLSPYTHSLADKLGIDPCGKCPKLVTNLKSKQRYVVHYRNLKLYVRLGMVVTKIHRVISFEQSRWLKPYIDFNTNERKHAKSAFEKDFFKLMNNSVFGKTMENVRKHKDVRLVSSAKQMKKLSSKPNFKSFKIFSEHLVAVEMSKRVAKLFKPTYVGMSILDVSKMLMFEFHYDKIRSIYGQKAKLLMTDTDSLVYHIETPDVYADLLQDLDAYDTSDYPTNHPAYSKKNTKALGKMKDEYNGRPIAEFVGLRAKMYSILEANRREKKVAKGISKRVTAKMLHENYVTALLDEQTTKIVQQQICSKNHSVVTAEIIKAGLSPYDDKRYVMDDKASTLAHGHYKIP